MDNDTIKEMILIWKNKKYRIKFYHLSSVFYKNLNFSIEELYNR